MRAVLFAVASVLALPPIAAAHGNEPGGFVSHVGRIAPDLGVEAEASGDGDLTMTAPAQKIVLVDGTAADPAHRFAGGKVYERRPGATTWTQVAEGRTYTWHDHRIHWEGPEPEAVERAPGEHHHIRDWVVRGSVDGERFAISGALEWQPKKSGPGLEWISYVVIAGGIAYAVFLLVVRRRA